MDSVFRLSSAIQCINTNPQFQYSMVIPFILHYFPIILHHFPFAFKSLPEKSRTYKKGLDKCTCFCCAYYYTMQKQLIEHMNTIMNALAVNTIDKHN